MKKILFFLSLILILTFFTGCWGYREIEDIALVSGIGIDIDNKTGEYIVNVEIVDAEQNVSSIQFIPILVEVRGDTIFDALRNSIALTTKKLNFSHTTFIVVSEEFAKEGILPVLDWLTRQKEPRLTLHIYVSREKTAKEILLKEDKISKMRTFEIEEVTLANNYLAKSPHIEAYQIINQIITNQVSTVLPTIAIVKINNRDFSLIEGSAYFKADKLAGFFDSMETMKYLFVINQIKQGLLIIDMENNNNNNRDKVSLEIFKNKTKIDIDIEDQEIFITVSIKSFVTIGEIDNGIDFSNKEGRILLKGSAEEFMEKEIKQFIKTAQDRGVDVFGFGDLLNKKYPKVWKDIEENWDSIFKELNIKVISTIYIKNSGHISKPIIIGE